MGLLDTIKTAVGTKVVAPAKKKLKEHESKKRAAAVAMRNKRSKSAPLIGKIAKQYHAGVDILEDHARVFKNVKGEERSVNIPYGIDAETIKNKMDRAFLTESFSSKAKRGVKSLNQVIKSTGEIKKELKKTGLGRGSMWENGGSGGSMGGSMYGDPSKIFGNR